MLDQPGLPDRRKLQMNFVPSQVESGSPSAASPLETPRDARARSHTKQSLDEVLQALGIPFDLAVIQWRDTEYSDDGTHGLMLPYADPRAYSDRLNDVFTPAGWSRKYAVQASAPVQRSRRGPAAKILVTCEVTIACIGSNSGTGEEWSDKENALTAAEAQAFKRALSCFGLGRYLYDIDGEWVELGEHRLPTKIPKLPRWATPNGWLAGLRPKPKRNRHALVRANGHARNAGHPAAGVVTITDAYHMLKASVNGIPIYLDNFAMISLAKGDISLRQRFVAALHNGADLLFSTANGIEISGTQG